MLRSPPVVEAGVNETLAIKDVGKELPSYQHGALIWWSEVIKRTANGAGADPQSKVLITISQFLTSHLRSAEVQANLMEVVELLLHRFSSKEGYNAFSDAVPTGAAPVDSETGLK